MWILCLWINYNEKIQKMIENERQEKMIKQMRRNEHFWHARAHNRGKDVRGSRLFEKQLILSYRHQSSGASCGPLCPGCARVLPGWCPGWACLRRSGEKERSVACERAAGVAVDGAAGKRIWSLSRQDHQTARTWMPMVPGPVGEGLRSPCTRYPTGAGSDSPSSASRWNSTAGRGYDGDLMGGSTLFSVSTRFHLKQIN